MCISCSAEPNDDTRPSSAVTRRSVLAGIGGLAAAVGLSACKASTPTRQTAAPATTPVAASPAPTSKLAVVLLGTQAGPPIVADRAGISTALVVDGAVYVIDCGRASATQYRRSGLQFRSLNKMFITHLHADHVADYYNFFMLGGTTDPRLVDGVSRPIPVYGPGPAGGLPSAFGGAAVSTAEPADPTPGLADLTQRCNEAFAYSDNLFMRDSRTQDISKLPVPHEIALPSVGASFTDTAPRMSPFPVMADDHVRVTATLVPHGPVFPSFAFRFDTEHGSVTFSGDTRVSDNLVELAHGSDLLVHEAVNLQGTDLPAAGRSHMLQSHTEVQHVGAVAARADVPKLVLSHLADFGTVLDPAQWAKWAKRGYSGNVTVGSDLQTIVVR